MKALYDEQKKMFEDKVKELTDKFQKKIDEVMAIYNDAKAQIDAAVNAIKDLENKVREIWNNVQEEAKKIIKEIIDDFINDAQSMIAAKIPDIDQMEQLALDARANLIAKVNEAVPRLRQSCEGIIQGIFDEFRAIVVNASMLFDRVKGFVKEIAVMLGPLLGGAGNLVWMDENNTEIESAMVGKKVKLVAKADSIPNGETVTVKIWEKDDDGQNDFVKEYTAEVKDEKVIVEWDVIYMEDTDDTNSQQELAEKGYTIPEYIFTIESSKYEFKEVSSVLTVQDWIEFELRHPETGEPYKNVDYKIVLPDGKEIKGTTDENGFVRQEGIPPGKCDIIVEAGPRVKSMKWTKDGNEVTEAMVGEKVKMEIEFGDIPDGEEMKVTIMEKDTATPDDEVKKIEPNPKVQSGKIEFEWEVIYVEDLDDANSQVERDTLGYTKPEYVTVVESDKYKFKVESELLNMKDWIEMFLKDEETGEAIANEEYVIKLSTGEERKGKTDGDGYLYEDNVAPGNVTILIDGYSIELIQKGRQKRK